MSGSGIRFMPERIVGSADKDIEPSGGPRDRRGIGRQHATQRLPWRPRAVVLQSMPQRIVRSPDKDV